jgi:hypothetical protein
MALGLALAIAGIAAIVAGVLVGNSRYEDGVKKLARAPVGCTTTLQFDKSGTYRLYLETKGKVTSVGGDCGAGGSFEHTGSAPQIDELTLVDAAGDEQSLKDASGKDYDSAGSKGAEIRTVELADSGTYRLTVKSSDTEFAVAVGKDPKGDGESLRNLGVGAGTILLVLGIVFTLLGLRRRPGPATVATPAWTPSTPAAPAPPMATWGVPPAPSAVPPPPPPPSAWDTPPPPPPPG